VDDSYGALTLTLLSHSILHLEQFDANLRQFWSNLSLDLFKNVWQLYEQIDAQFLDRSPDESTGAQVAVSGFNKCYRVVMLTSGS